MLTQLAGFLNEPHFMNDGLVNVGVIWAAAVGWDVLAISPPPP